MTSEPTIDLPNRVVVGTNGAYWRDYGDHYSMCPVSDDNEPVEFAAVYSRSRPGDGVYVSQEWLDERMADSMRERAALATAQERLLHVEQQRARLREALDGLVTATWHVPLMGKNAECVFEAMRALRETATPDMGSEPPAEPAP